MMPLEPNKSALVVDDSRVIRTIVSRALQDLGFTTSEATNGREAMTALEKGPVPAVIMIDWNMPEMSGLEVVKAVRANSAWDDIRLVMVTSENENERVVEALDAGANEYIMKPFAKEMIQEKLLLMGLPLLNPTST